MDVREALDYPVRWAMYWVSLIKGGRFTGFDPNQHRLESKWVENGVEFWVPQQEGLPWAESDDARAVCTNIIFNNPKDLELSEPEILESKTEDAFILRPDNRGGTRDLQERYEFTYAKAVTQSERFLEALEESAREWFGSGEEQVISTGVELTETAREEFEKTHSEEVTVQRVIEETCIIPPGERHKIWGTRKVDRTKRIARGKANLQFKFFIGSFSYWAGVIPVWDWEYEWASFTEFLDVVERKGYGSLSDEFRTAGIPQNQIDAVRRPSGNTVEIPYIYDNELDAEVKVENITEVWA